MIVNERESRHEHVLQVGRQMMTAARTAPKGKGIDIIEVGMVTDQDIVRLSEEMVRYSEESGMKFLLRDAENLQQAEAVIIIGTAQ
ncbi:MAG TPA: ferredoxin, partial [Porphyromonadaceae bacterium]|nr:ferredoxin [Porphyromonadaceae bacterium]